jgi:hypothetical protein
LQPLLIKRLISIDGGEQCRMGTNTQPKMIIYWI